MSFCVVIFSSTNIRWSDSCSVVVISTAEILLPKNQAGNCFHRGGVKSKKVQSIIIKYQQAFLNCVSTLYWEMKICYLLHYFHFSFFEFTFINKGKWRCFSHLNGSQFSLFDIAYILFTIAMHYCTIVYVGGGSFVMVCRHKKQVHPSNLAKFLWFLILHVLSVFSCSCRSKKT